MYDGILEVYLDMEAHISSATQITQKEQKETTKERGISLTIMGQRSIYNSTHKPTTLIAPQRQRNSGENGSDSNDESPVTRTGRVRAGVSCHLTPTKRRRRTAGGELTVQRLQGRCKCGKKTTYLCLPWIRNS